MASQRPGLGPSGLPADSRLKSPGTIAPPGSLLLKRRGGGESTTERVRTLPQPKMPSRLPQSLPQRRLSDTQPEPIQPRVTTGNRNSKIFGNTTSITSASSSRLPAPTSKPRNVLRRKNSGISQEVVNSIRKNSRDETGNHSKSSSSSSASNSRSQISTDSSASSRSDRNPTMNTMEIRVAHQIEVAVGAPQAPTLYPELDRYRDVKVPAYNGSLGIEVPYPLTTHDLPPPTPLFSGSSSQMSGFSSSPCTRFSESPGPGPYSRDTTPTSMSSQSPGMVAPLRFPGASVRMRQVDSTQTRPPVSRRRGGSISNELDLVSADPQGLPSVRESLTSSSSNSTVRELERKDSSKKRKQLSSLAPSPPPRISSHKFTKSHDGSLSPPRSWRAPPTQPAATATTQLLPKPGSFSRPRPAQTIQQVPPPRGQPPRRPSRDGTPDLHSQLGLPIPVIQSNLTSTPSEKRSSKLLAPATVTRPGLLSSTSDTHVHLLRPAITREATPAPKMSRMVEYASTIKAEPGRATRTPSPGVSTFRRFPLFGRRTKTAPEVPLQKDEKKPTRKGPAAGTGHEGYGRVGPARRRSNSLANTTRAIPGTMSSQESIGTNDSFLLERMAPVVIAGGEIVENRNVGSELSRTESSQSVTRERPSVESQNGSQASLNSTPRNTLWPSAFPRVAQHTQSASVSSRRPSESSESEAPIIKSTLALRRSIQRLKSGEKEPPRIPAPIVTQPHVTSPSITSIDASVLMTDDSMLAPSIDAAQGIKAAEGSKNLSGPKRLMKRARSPRKWNFFGRNHSQPVPDTKKVEVPENVAPVAAVAATVKVVQSKPLAFYTMMDSSEQEDTDIPDLEEVLREAKSPDSPTPKQIPDFQHKKPEERRPSVTQENMHPGFSTSDVSVQVPTVAELEHMLPVKLSKLPTPPSLPLPAAPQAANITARTQGRPSRLPQVGRIPKVISARAEQISPKSFSRPFHRLSVQATPSKMDLRDAYSIAKGPSPPRPSTPVQMEPTTAVVIEAPVLTQSPGLILPTYYTELGEEFLSFSPRKGSQCTTNTTTSSSSGGFNFAEATAIIPEPGAPLAEDEIWDEYDDLFGDETLKQPQSVRSTRSSFGNQFHLEKYTATPTRRIEPPLESPTLRSQFQEQQVQSLTQIMHSERIPVSSSVYSSDMAEKVKQLLTEHPSPRCSLEPEIPEESEMQPQNEVVNKQSKQEQELEIQKQRNSLPVNDPRRSDSSGCSQSSEDGSPLVLVNLRVGSMTVSKWLTFGHVLFSPVRDELLNDVGSLKRPSILVIDGLGNDDWTFYAAETYPAATFFNLSPRPPRPAARNGLTGLPLSPPNHYQTQYISHTGKFPFGAESFTAVVFRFPAAAPEAHYRNIISEARRVLKPGGYIELSILDVDLNNMGNRGRKAVRRLKERINAKSPDVSLGSTSDLILRLLGRKGFVDLKTCRVGVPVASVIPRSSGSENSKRSSDAGKNKTIKDERSLPEMISDGSPVADESITKMVAKVGRWWYSRCYESAAGTGIGPGTLGSMWRDKALLAECEEWGTSLKLMVCHARVPDGRPRLASI